MSESSKSPSVYESNVIATFGFAWAIQRVINGERITKLEWGNPEIYGMLRDGLLMLHKDDGKWYKWIVNDGDLLGEDWTSLD